MAMIWKMLKLFDELEGVYYNYFLYLFALSIKTKNVYLNFIIKELLKREMHL